MSNLASCFRANLPPETTPAAPSEASLEAELASFFEAARAAWPTLDLDAITFVKYVATHSLDGSLPDVHHASDMYLACACAHGVVGALREFEVKYAEAISRAVSRIDSSPSFIDEARQRLRERLFVSTQGLPKIATYRGRAPLVAWVTLAASRAGLMLRRGEARRRETTGGGPAALATQDSAEVALLKRRYAVDLAAAVAGAFAKLSDKQRALLELNVVSRLSIDKLGEIFRVDRATAARWLASARKTLADETRREIRRRLRITDSDYCNLVMLVQSQLEVSLVRLLQA